MAGSNSDVKNNFNTHHRSLAYNLCKEWNTITSSIGQWSPVTSYEFQQFMDINGIKHIKTTPCHPSSNGLAERFVQSFKQAMRASKKDSGTISKKLAKFLLAYRSTPHQTTNETPSMLFMKRELKTRLHNIKPNIKNHVITKQEEMCNRRNFHDRQFECGQSVIVRDYRGNQKWQQATIKQKTGPRSYRVETHEGSEWRRHTDQILDSTPDTKRSDLDNIIEPNVSVEEPTKEQSSVKETITSTPAPTQDDQTERRYPQRIRKAPRKMEDYVTN